MVRPFDCFVIFAEMRTGSNFLESNLDLFPGLQCFGETFNPYFIVSPSRPELFGMTLEARNADPLRLIEKMKDGTEGIPGFRFFSDHDPRVFDAVMADPRCAKVVLSRNLIDSYVSRKIAWETDQWWLDDMKNVVKAKARFVPEEFEKLFYRMHDFRVKLLHELQVTGQTAFYIDYEDLNDLDVINGLARFLGEETRIDGFSSEFKKQNPEVLADKVKNFDALAETVQRIGVFDLERIPNFEPRRTPMVPSFVTPPKAPLLFMPVQAGPDARVRAWLAAIDGGTVDDLTTGFTQKDLRQWKRRHRGHRSFTVLRHPVARAHAAFCQHFLGHGPKTYWDIRRTLIDVYGVQIPEEAPVSGEGYDRRQHREAFLAFLKFVRGNLNGQTAIRTDGAWASLGHVVQGFSQVNPPDRIIREHELEEALDALAREVGVEAPAVAAEDADLPYALSEIYDDEVEEAVKAAYQRDYMLFGFKPWDREPGHG